MPAGQPGTLHVREVDEETMGTKLELRFADEFHHGGRAIDRDAPPWALRVFGDGCGLTRAGLYPNSDPQEDDDWSRGEPLTDATDLSVIMRLLPGGRERQTDTLMAIAYQRLARMRKRALNVRVPAVLRPWAVRFEIGRAQAGPVIVMAANARAAEIAAAMMALYDAARTAQGRAV